MKSQIIATIGFTFMLACSSDPMLPEAHRDPDMVKDASVPDDASVLETDASTPPDASIPGAPPEMFTETCNKTFGNNVYAEHVYPGKSAFDLRDVRVIASGLTGSVYGPNYDTAMYVPTIADGRAAFSCGGINNPAPFSSVVFVSP